MHRLRKPRDTLPFVGNGIRFLQPRQVLFSWFAQREREFGYETYQISVPTLPPGVVINDPANLEYIFKNEALFNKGEFVKRRSWDLFGPCERDPAQHPAQLFPWLLSLITLKPQAMAS
jgi:hypothetical protein